VTRGQGGRAPGDICGMTEKRPNTGGVRAALIDAVSPVSGAFREGVDPELGQVRVIDGVEEVPGKWQPDLFGLPKNCPVVPLGVDDDVYYFLDTIGQLRGIPYNSAGKKAVQSLFMGRALFAAFAWPKWNEREKKVTGLAADDALDCLFGSCAMKGPWTAVERIRGRGAHLGLNGELVLHCGDALYQAHAGIVIARPLGELGRHVYATRPPVPKPFGISDDRHEKPEPVAPEDRPARTLVPLLRSWNWLRPAVDPWLMLGDFGVAMIGGALGWRPTTFITGDKSTGKSTLQKLFRLTLGDGLVHAADTSAAGIYQHIGHDTLPVAVDELESESDPRKQKAIIKLARLAASGAVMLRGGSEHQGVEFQARSAFFFSSINRPALEPQDLSRLCLLQLEKLTASMAPPPLRAQDLELVGRRLLRLLAEGFHRFDALLEEWQARLGAIGHDQRGKDTYGTLLAMAELIVGDDFELLEFPLPDDPTWREWLEPSKLPELEDARENWRGCLDHLLSVPVEAWRNGTRTVPGQVVSDYWLERRDDGEARFGFDEANKLLRQAGLALVQPRMRGEPTWLAVPNQNPLVAKLYGGTKWGGEPSAGVWAGALRQGKRWNAGAGGLWELGQVRINGVASKATLISLEEICEKAPDLLEHAKEAGA
jgi:hypothetical protein